MSNTRREKGSSILRVLDIIETIARAEHPMPAAELAFRLDIPKATVHRLIQTLEREGFLQINMRGHLMPAQRLQDIAFGVLYSGRFKAQRQAILQGLAEQSGETCGIAIPDGVNMVYYDRVQSNWPLQIYLPTGSHVPLWCTSSGKLYLSQLPEADLERILRNLPLQQRARNTLTDPDALKQALIPIRENQLGTDNEEFIDGMVACSVPIRQHGRLLACLFCHAPVLRQSFDDMMGLEPLLREAASELEAMLALVDEEP
ncbi:IclR family transcriptional regulator [Chromohalobacter israelensis]|nr:IclR family transcriptional regulator [Chromohalobacter israelensis]